MSGKVILVTKNRIETEKHFSSLSTSGFEIIYFPTIKIIPVLDSEEVNQKFLTVGEFDWLIFTSVNAVEVFTQLASRKKIMFDTVKVACVGNETAERCFKKNIKVDLVPNEFSASGLLNEFSKINLIGKKVFIPCSNLSRSELKVELSELGAEVTSVPIYNVTANDENNLLDELGKIRKNKPDAFVFTSPSSFCFFLKIMDINNAPNYFEKSVVCAIGKTTQSAILDFGVQVNIVPELFSLNGVQDAIKKYYRIEKHIA